VRGRGAWRADGADLVYRDAKVLGSEARDTYIVDGGGGVAEREVWTHEAGIRMEAGAAVRGPAPELGCHVRARLTASERKALPITSGVLDYFPDALLEVAECSRVGNDQHNPGQPLHWAKEKSTDEADALVRHLLDRGKRDADGVRHSAKVAWRALAMLQREIEAETGAKLRCVCRLDTDRIDPACLAHKEGR
jgi:hypothetical protein